MFYIKENNYCSVSYRCFTCTCSHVYAHTLAHTTLSPGNTGEKRQAQKELQRLGVRKRGPKSGKGLSLTFASWHSSSMCAPR